MSICNECNGEIGHAPYCKQPKQHKWHKEIKAWADGANIEVCYNDEWIDCLNPNWNKRNTYRIKPQLKPDLVRYGTFNFKYEHGCVIPLAGIAGNYVTNLWTTLDSNPTSNFKVTFADDGNGEYKLKYMEVL